MRIVGGGPFPEIHSHRAATSREDGHVTEQPRARAAGDAPYVPLDGTPWRLTMGLRRLDESGWLEVDDDRSDILARKSELLVTHRDTVLVNTEGSTAPCVELLELVVSWLRTYRPEILAIEGPVYIDQVTGARLDTRELHPLVTGSMLATEDLCVLEHRDAAWRLTAACVCSPSRWSLTEKLGRSLDEIHGPVPGFHEGLAGPSATFFDRLAPGRLTWRVNWTLLDTPEPFLPSPAGRHAPRDRVDLGALWFRVERQTLRRLVGTDAIVFTIRTYVTSLDALLVSRPELASLLASTLRTVPSEVADYKGWTGLLEPLVGALEGMRMPE